MTSKGYTCWYIRTDSDQGYRYLVDFLGIGSRAIRANWTYDRNGACQFTSKRAAIVAAETWGDDWREFVTVVRVTRK